MISGAFKRLEAGDQSASGESRSEDFHALIRAIQSKKLEITNNLGSPEVIVNVPKQELPPVYVNHEIKVEPPAVLIRGMRRKDLLIAMSLPTAAILLDIVARIFIK